MSAGLSGVGPVSVRYAVQIRELLQSQSAKRAAAEQEVARAEQAARAAAARAEAIDSLRSSLQLSEPAKAPVRVDVKVDVKVDAKIEPEPAVSEEPAPIATADVAAGQLVDIEA